MKSFVIIAAVLAVGFGASMPQDEISERGLIDPIIKGVLESLRPKFANLTFQDVNETVVTPNLNATIQLSNIGVRNLDKFVIAQLKSNVLLMKLVNLTLTWNSIEASALYDINISILVPQVGAPINVFAKGAAKATLKQLFFTIGANMELKKALQVKPRGLFGFDVRVDNANVTLSSLMGRPELGQATGAFISQIIPGLVNDVKKPMFDAFQDEIIKVINGILMNNGSSIAADDEMISSEEYEQVPLLDLSRELFGKLAPLGNDFFENDF